MSTPIIAAGGKAVAVGGDVSKAGEAQGIIDAAIKKYGRLDILVNNSGVYEFAPIEAITEEKFHKMFNINVLGLLLTTQAALKHIGEGGSIINIGSVVSRITPPASVDLYRDQGRGGRHHRRACPRAGTEKDTRQRNQPRHGRDRRHARRRLPTARTLRRRLVAQTPLGRLGQPGDIASVAVFLASDDSGWLTGEHILAGGGLR